MNMSKIKDTMVSLYSNTKEKLKDASPNIKIGAGVALIVGGGAYACWKTYKDAPEAIETSKKEIAAIHEKKEIVDKAQEEIEQIEGLPEDAKTPDPEADTNHAKELIKAYSRAVWRVTKIYGPSVAMTLFGIVLVGKGTSDLNAKIAAGITTVAMLQNRLDLAYSRMIEEYGQEKADEIFLGVKTEKIKTELEDENGKKKLVAEEVKVIAAPPAASFVHFFDEMAECTNDSHLDYSIINAQTSIHNARLTMAGVSKVRYSDILLALGMREDKITMNEMMYGWPKGSIIDLRPETVWVKDPETGRKAYSRIMINPAGMVRLDECYATVSVEELEDKQKALSVSTNA